MAERLVDVLDSGKNVIHTFPITIEGSETSDAQYEKKALEAAAYEKLVPNNQLNGLTARMHISRRGPLEPYGDDRDVLAQTKESLDQIVRERAYLLWEQEGRPEERADEALDRTREFEGLEPLEAPDPHLPTGSKRNVRQRKP